MFAQLMEALAKCSILAELSNMFKNYPFVLNLMKTKNCYCNILSFLLWALTIKGK
jgi:hypothetical protein